MHTIATATADDSDSASIDVCSITTPSSVVIVHEPAATSISMHDVLVLNKENENRRKQIFDQVSQPPSLLPCSDIVLLRLSRRLYTFIKKMMRTHPLQYLWPSLL